MYVCGNPDIKPPSSPRLHLLNVKKLWILRLTTNKHRLVNITSLAVVIVWVEVSAMLGIIELLSYSCNQVETSGGGGVSYVSIRVSVRGRAFLFLN